MTAKQLEPVFGADSHPEATRVLEERRELFRLAGVNALARSRNGRDLTPEARADALRWAAYVPLGRPLSTGEPARAPEGGGA
jgi:hypothetical protein